MKNQKTNLLDAIPVASNDILVKWEGECVILAFPRFKKQWMRKYLLPKGMSPYLNVTLDAHGSKVWSLIDGKHTVSEIIDLLSRHFEGEEDYPSRVAAFIMQLQKDHFISLLLAPL